MEEHPTFALAYDEGCEEYELNEDQRMEGMCRICASSNNDLIPIFDSVVEGQGINELINNHLPILVTPNDLLPISICAICLQTLSSIHSLVEHCVKADEKMRQMLQNAAEGFPHLNNYDVLSVDESDAAYPIGPAETNSKMTEENKEKQLNSTNDQAVSNKETCRVPGEKKLYRCLYCSLTDSDAYMLLLHQIKSHPGKLLKCNDCDFVYSADQKLKYDEHIKQHALAPKELPNISDQEQLDNALSKSLDTASSCLSKETSNLVEVLSKSKDTRENIKLSKLSNQTTNRKPKQIRDTMQGNADQVRKTCNYPGKKVTRNEVHWRCGFCGMKAKSKMGLIDHCNLRHKERVGLSFSNAGALECSRCKQTFQCEVWLKDHLCHSTFLPKTIPSSKPLSCLSCPEVFTEVKQFREHLMSHTNSVKCHVCGAHFRSELNLRSHLEKHEKKTLLECPHCPKSFRLRSRMKIHMRTHTGEKPFMCVKCGKCFSTDCGFRLHMAAHEGKKPYVCSLCGQTFNRPSNLRRHESLCGESKLKCRICEEKFSTREEMHCHRAMHSKVERDSEQVAATDRNTSKDDRFSCKVCGMKFDRVVELSQHRQESHTAAEIDAAKKAGHADGGAFICPECGKELYSKKNYERHMLIHSGNNQFSCKECSNIYSTKFALEYHMYTHTGERPFKCDLCPEGFKTRISLRIHRMKHTGEKPYKCRLCSMRFMTAASLRLHLVTHSDSRMFSCNFCPATFKRKKTLVTHVRIHTGEKPYACKFCGRRFTQKGSCSQHEKAHSQSKSIKEVDGLTSDMHVTVIKNWRDEVIEPFSQNNSSGIDILVTEDDNSTSSAHEEVQHMVLIQHVEPELMEISEDIELQNNHTIVLEQEGILVDIPVTGLKDANLDPQMPVPDE